jgi:hypothetical protein
MVAAAGKVVRVDGTHDPELYWGMRGNGASFGIVTEFVVRLRDMPNHGIIRSAPILWAADKAKDVMTSWMGRIGRHDRRDTETLQFVFMHSPDGHPVCGVVPLIVGENEATAKAVCDELAAFGGGALVRQDTQLPYTTLQAALDERFPFNANYWDKGVVIDWDPRDPSAVNGIVDTAVKHWGEKPEFASNESNRVAQRRASARRSMAEHGDHVRTGQRGLNDQANARASQHGEQRCEHRDRCEQHEHAIGGIGGVEQAKRSMCKHRSSQCPSTTTI